MFVENDEIEKLKKKISNRVFASQWIRFGVVKKDLTLSYEFKMSER